MMTMRMRRWMSKMDKNTRKTYKRLFRLIKDIWYAIVAAPTIAVVLNSLDALLEFIIRVKAIVTG